MKRKGGYDTSRSLSTSQRNNISNLNKLAALARHYHSYKNGNPVSAKSCIVVLSNFEDHYYTKSLHYVPNLKYSSLCLLCSQAISHRHTLQQGECKNTFCHAHLPDDEVTVVRPPFHALGDMGLTASKHDPCLFSSVITTMPSLSDEPNRVQVHDGIYVDDFIYYSTDPLEELCFQDELKKRVVVNFMGLVDWFLGTAFTWKKHDDSNLSVFLSQTTFTKFTAHGFAINKFKQVQHVSLPPQYPINSIDLPDKHDPDLKRLSYNNSLSHEHYIAAIYVLQYLYSTAEYGIRYHYAASSTIQAFNHIPAHHDKEAYTDAIPPAPGNVSGLTRYSDACWGGQFGNVVLEGTPLLLFKYCSTSGYAICPTGGPSVGNPFDKIAPPSALAKR
eukprot:CCRYP_011183-RA/>CCRYP_011183-RA protein AED:0.30 eAED:0.40 QI:0/0/0/1/0/0.25/4/0/387